MSKPEFEPVSTIIIGKNCADNLRQCLESLRPFVLPHLGDEVIYLDTGSTDGGKTLRIAKKWGCRTLEHPDLSVPGMLDLIAKYFPDRLEDASKDPQFKNGFLADFAAARQIATDAARNDIIFWIDTDDLLLGGDRLRALAHDFFSKPSNNCLFLAYDYTFDIDGTPTTVLWRERLFRRSKYEWLGVCHETAIPRNRTPEAVLKCNDPAIRIAHKNHRANTKWSDIRNYCILRKAYDDAATENRWLDPRWDLYLGNAMRGLEKYDEAVEWYARLLKRSGCREDRHTAAVNIGTIYTIKERPWRALDWFWQAIKILPTEPRNWFAIARCYHKLKKHPEALLYTRIGEQLPRPDLLTATDPTGYDFYPACFAALSAAELGDWDTSLRYIHRAHSLRPDFPPAREALETLTQKARNAAVGQAIETTLRHAASRDTATAIVAALAPEVRRGFRQFQLESPYDREPGTITYLCNGTCEPWDGTSSTDGVGGSEKMVLMLARQWASAGRPVEVFGNPKDANLWKTIDGITWKPAEAFNVRSRYDTLILWRQHYALDLPLRARRIYVDLHDVPSPDHFLEARMMRVDGYLFKSHFHASPVRDIVPPEKLVITRNAIDLNALNAATADAPPRDLQKVVFCSSADRGLDEVLRIWPFICHGYPNASLHIYYGFTPLYRERAATAEYSWIGTQNAERHLLDYEEECYSLMDRLPRVHFHGRVSHDELARSLRTAGIWLYPTRFPEISCMSAMEAQALGAWPVVYPTAALAETVFAGERASDVQSAVQAIKRTFARGHDLDTARAEMAAEARRRFSLTALATDWLALFKDPVLCLENSSPASEAQER